MKVNLLYHSLLFVVLFLSVSVCSFGQTRKGITDHSHWRNEVQNNIVEPVSMDNGALFLCQVTSGDATLYCSPSTDLLNVSGIKVGDNELLPVCGVRNGMYRVIYKGNQYYVPSGSVWLKNTTDNYLMRLQTFQLRQLIKNSYAYDKSLYEAIEKKADDYEAYCRESGIGIIEAYPKLNKAGMTDYYITLYNPTNSYIKEVEVKIMGVDGHQNPIEMSNGKYEYTYKSYPIEPLSEKGTKFEYVWNNSSVQKVFISSLKVKYKGKKTEKISDPQSLVMPDDVKSYLYGGKGGKTANVDDYLQDERINKEILSSGKVKNVNNRYLNNGETITSIVDERPMISGGINSIYGAVIPVIKQEYFKRYKDGTRRTYIHCIIDKDGNICNIRVDDIDNNSDMANNIKRALYELPKWVPATYNKKPVNYQVDIPLVFNIYSKDGHEYAQCFSKHENIEFKIR